MRDAVTYPADNCTASLSPRRVLYVDHTALMGGGEIALLNLARHLDFSRYEPVVALFSDGPLRQKLEESGVETHVLAASATVINARKDSLGGSTFLRARDVLSTIALTLRLRRFIRDARVDVVHTNSLKADIIGGIAGRLAGKWVIWHVRDRIADDYLPSTVVRIFRWLARVVPHLVVGNSNSTLSTLWLKKSDRTAAIPSGIPHLREEAVSPKWLRLIHDGTTDTDDLTSETVDGARQGPLIGIVGRISPWKGQHIFLQAAEIVRRRFPSARFQIIGAALFGEKEYEQTLQTLVNDLHLADAVEFTGFRTDVPKLISGLDVLVHGSTTAEPFGQVVIEGMAAGKPVVATNGGGIPEIVVDGVTGLLVPMGNAQKMAEAIEHLVANPQIASEMGRRGYWRVRERFTIEQTAAKVQTLYDHLLDGPADSNLRADTSNAEMTTDDGTLAASILPSSGAT